MEIWKHCKITDKFFNTQRGFLNHLRCVGMSSKDYYDKFYKKEGEDKCFVCGKDTTYHGFKYKKYCNSSCYLKTQQHKDIVSKRFVNNPKALESFTLKRKGVDPNISKRILTLTKKAENIGLSLEEYMSMIIHKNRKPRSKEDIMRATEKAMQTKHTNNTYGGRSGYKKYMFFDTLVSLQGYEPIVLKSLIEDFKLSKEDIITGKDRIPIIHYANNRMYFPDFYLPRYNLIIEVKSNFTLMQHKNTVLLKCQATIESGYSILLLVVDHNEVRKNKLDGSKKLLDWAISSQDPKPTWYGYGSTTIP